MPPPPTDAVAAARNRHFLDEPTCHQLRVRHHLKGAGALTGDLKRPRSASADRSASDGESPLAKPTPSQSTVATRSELHLGRFSALTALYALLEGVATHPYELIKTRQQASAPGALAHRMGTLSYLLHLRRAGGLGELYRGFGWAVLAGIPSEVVYYVGYTECKRALLGTSMGACSPSSVFLASGAIADALSVLVSVPADVVSQRLQLQGLDGGGARERTGVQVAMDIFKREGAMGLWRGTGATLAFFGPNSAVWWLTHEHAKAAFSERAGGPGGGTATSVAGFAGEAAEAEPSNGVLVASGALAGGVSTIFTNPLDVVKTRLQTAPTAVPISEVLRAVTRTAGWRGLYAGLVPRLLAIIPRSICTVLAYERAVEFCRKRECAL